MVTFKPRDSRIDAVEAAAIPLPKEDTTPPVIKIYLVTNYSHIRKNNKKEGELSPSLKNLRAFYVFTTITAIKTNHLKVPINLFIFFSNIEKPVMINFDLISMIINFKQKTIYINGIIIPYS